MMTGRGTRRVGRTVRSNSSPLFLRLCEEVERLIRNDAHALIGGRADMTARTIMAQLSHKHGLRPPTDQEGDMT